MWYEYKLSMQRILQFFNPDSDLALADADPNYIAPRMARKMGEDLSVLPCWYSSQDEAVLIADKGSLKNWNSPHPQRDFFVFDMPMCRLHLMNGLTLENSGYLVLF